jgi:hypothetical protein
MLKRAPACVFQAWFQACSRRRVGSRRTVPAMNTTEPLSRTAAAWRLAATALAFVAAYTACNHLTHARGNAGHGVLAWEGTMPFLPWTIVPYLSIFGFFALSFGVARERPALDRHVVALAINLGLSVLCWLAVPLRFAFERPPVEGWAAPLFTLLAWTDLPYNRAPSLHISVLVILAARLVPLLAGWQRLLLLAWFGLVALSVLTTWQHHLVDIPTGVLVATVSLRLARHGTMAATWPGPSPTSLPTTASNPRRGACSPTASR